MWNKQLRRNSVEKDLGLQRITSPQCQVIVEKAKIIVKYLHLEVSPLRQVKQLLLSSVLVGTDCFWDPALQEG